MTDAYLYQQKRRPPEVARFLRQFCVDDRHDVTNSLLDAGLRSYNNWVPETRTKLDVLLRATISESCVKSESSLKIPRAPSVEDPVVHDAYQGVMPTPRARSEERQSSETLHRVSESSIVSKKRVYIKYNSKGADKAERKYPGSDGSDYLVDQGLHPNNDLDPVTRKAYDVRSDIVHRRSNARANYGRFDGPDFIFVGHDYRSGKRKVESRVDHPSHDPIPTSSDTRLYERPQQPATTEPVKTETGRVDPESVCAETQTINEVSRNDIGCQSDCVPLPEQVMTADKECETLLVPSLHKSTVTDYKLDACDKQIDAVAATEHRSTLTDHQELELRQENLWKERTALAIDEAIGIALSLQARKEAENRISISRTGFTQTGNIRLLDVGTQSETTRRQTVSTETDVLLEQPSRDSGSVADVIVQKSRTHRFVASFEDEPDLDESHITPADVQHYTVTSEHRGLLNTVEEVSDGLLLKDPEGNESTVRVFDPDFVYEMKQLVLSTRGIRLSTSEVKSALPSRREECINHSGFANLYRSLLVMYHLNTF